MTTLEEFVKEAGITMELERTQKNPHMYSAKMINYLVTLSLGSRKLQTYFSTGEGWVINAKGESGGGMVYYDTASKRFLERSWQGRVTEANPGWKIQKPSICDVLDCLASDAAGIENAKDFDDWADEYGYSRDSHSAEETYNICKKQARELESLLGRELYDQLLWEVERL